MSVLDQTKSYCRYFEEISAIPRGSKNEKAISDYLVKFADSLGLKSLQDDMYNVVVYKNASCGYENQPTLILQAHIDMVCTKEPGCTHDFEKDPLDLYVEDGFLKARGTTLGADDGTGVAMIMAILADDSLIHPAIEAVFTVQEEIGLCGASHLKGEYFKGTRMINLDTGGENTTCVSSSGGMRVSSVIKVNRVSCDSPYYVINVGGLKGGHSGGCINLNRGNAIKLMARVLHMINDLQLVSIECDGKENAIASECQAVIASDVPFSEINKVVQSVEEQLKIEYSDSDENVFVKVDNHEVSSKPLDHKSTKDVINYLYLCPNGLQASSQSIKDLPTVSLNAGIVKTLEDKIVLSSSIRSPMASAKNDLLEHLKALGKLTNTSVEGYNSYDGWAYEPNSNMRKMFKEVCISAGYDGLNEHAGHGGLETGIFKGIIPELDIVTTGPNGSGAHSPEEKLDLASFDRTFNLVKAMVEKCAKE